MAARRNTPRAVTVSRASTPAEADGAWNGTRLRSRQASVDAPPPSPTKVTRTVATRVTGSTRVVAASTGPSIADSENGSLDPTTGIRRNTGKRSRNARAGTTGNSYGAVVDAQSSQMASGNPMTGLSGTMNSQLHVAESSEQRVQNWRTNNDLDAADLESGSREGSPNRLLSAVREESEEVVSDKSFGQRHEYAIGRTESRSKSFSADHEGGIANHIQRRIRGEPIVASRESSTDHVRNSRSPGASTPDHIRNSLSPRTSSLRTSPLPRIDTPENFLTWDERASIWYNGHKNTIRTILALLALLVAGLLYGQTVWNNAKNHLSSPTTLPDGAIQPAVTVTSHVNAHKTTTVTEVIKETSVIAPRPMIQERRNYFNMEVGATIDPRFTSITRAPMNLLNSVLAPLSGKWFPGPAVNQADVALKPWTETGQSWCAASSDLGQGQLQLGVSLPFTVRPLAVTLEHQLEHLSFDTGNSARHVELWIESHEDSTGANVNNDCGPTPEGMNEFWFCVAKMEFSRFNGEEKSQRIEFRNEHIFTKHFAFRVMDNWGSDHTCLYRLQMHGEMKSKVVDGAGDGA